MKIAVSNIAWENRYLSEYLTLLKKLGCSGVEIAPNIIWDEPINSSNEDRKNFKNIIHKEGLSIVGFHALLFSRPDLQFFQSEESRKNTGVIVCNLDVIKFKGMEEIKKDPIFLQMKSLSDNSIINEIEMSSVSKQKSLKFSDRLALSRLNKDIKSKRPQFYEY